MQIVKFTSSYGAYRGGETAGFSQAEAARLVELGVAVLVTPAGKGAAGSKGEAKPPKGEAPPPPEAK